MNAKAKGTRAEHRSIRLFEAMGYACTRAAASLGTWDIIAIGPSDILLCQVKCNRLPSAAEWEQMRRFPAPPNVRKLLHVYRDGSKLPHVEDV